MSRTKQKILFMIARFLMGGVFLVFGLDGYLAFLPQGELTVEGMNFINSLKATGYLYYLLKALEVLCGLLIVSNLFIPLATLILAPIVVNIFLFGVFLDHSSLALASILVTCEIYLFWYFRGIFNVFIKRQLDINPNSPENQSSQRFSNEGLGKID